RKRYAAPTLPRGERVTPSRRLGRSALALRPRKVGVGELFAAAATWPGAIRKCDLTNDRAHQPANSPSICCAAPSSACWTGSPLKAEAIALPSTVSICGQLG